MKKTSIALYIITLLLLPFATKSQQSSAYFVTFDTKANTPYSIGKPYEFLSAKAIERRYKSGIAIDEHDLPVDPNYLHSLVTHGANIRYSLKWLNGATIISDTFVINNIKKLKFITSVTYLGPYYGDAYPHNPPPKARQKMPYAPKLAPEYSEKNNLVHSGYTSIQNFRMGALQLHALTHRGKDIWVAVMDGGFNNVDSSPFFDSLQSQNRLFSLRDIVDGDDYVYEAAAHGTSVLSVMAANIPDYFVGTAPEATYFLIKTEDTRNEFPIEETNWVAGAELADSIGVDIINASLGYTTFNDTSLNHTYAQLDGRTGIASKGATIAATRGMIICNSAGNSGGDEFRHIGIPADAPGILAIAAINSDNSLAYFSSVGPTADGRLKPDLAAPGVDIICAGLDSAQINFSSGTSVASPLTAGSFAALWSAFPQKTAQEIIDAVVATAALPYHMPDNQFGYGITNFFRAYLLLAGFQQPNGILHPTQYDNFSHEIQHIWSADQGNPTSVSLKNTLGETIKCSIKSLKGNELAILNIAPDRPLSPGFYTLRITTDDAAEMERCFRIDHLKP